MKKRLMAILLSLCMLLGLLPVTALATEELTEPGITDDIYTLEDGFMALTAVTALPYEGTVDLGGEGSTRYDLGSSSYVYGRLMKVKAEAGQMLNLEFYGQSNLVDTCIEVYSPKDDGGFTQVESYDYDNKNGYGESAKYIVEEDGTYYLAFIGYDHYETGLCNLEVIVSDAPEIKTLEEGFQGLTETTLPYSDTVTLGGEGSPLYDLGSGYYTYGRLMKVEAEAGQMLNLAFYGSSQEIDTVIQIYYETTDNVIQWETTYENNNKNGYGESAKYIVEEDGTYYLAFWGYDVGQTGMCNLEVSVSDAPEIKTLEEGFQGLTETTLPYKGTVDLGGEGSPLYYLGSGYYTYGRLMKVEAAAGQMLTLDFYGQPDSLDTRIAVYRPQDDGGFTQVGSYDYDNKNGDGESAKYIVPETGTYYLAFEGYDDYETGLCNLEVSVDTPEIKTLEEGFQGLTETTVLPYSGTVDLGGEGSTLYDMDGWYTYAELMKVELQEGQLLDLAFYGSSQNIDTYIEVYDENIEYVTYYDGNNKNGYGESAVFVVPETGTYYLAFEGYEDYETGLCNLEVSVIDNETVTTERLNFTADPVPVPGEDDLWTWDADTKTLTLKDGFQITAAVDELIVLPDGATVLVEGTAEIYNYGRNSILGEGSVTIRGVDPETSCLTISYDADDAIELDNDGSLTIEDVSMDITAGSDCLITEEDIIVKNARLKLHAGDEGLDPSGNAILENSEVEIYCSGTGIDASNNITVTGGKLIIDADAEALECDYLTFAQGVEVKLNTRDRDDYDLFNVYGIGEFSISDPVALYGSDGALLYSGLWSEDLMGAYYNPVVDGVQAYRIESGSLCELEITAGANGTWQKGTTEGLSFTANGAIDDFQKVQVDGKDLDASSYTIGENTTITLKPEYLETLPVGAHTISIVFDTGTATTEFTIIEADSDVCDGGEDCPTHDYDDVNKEAWYHPYVDYVVENGIMVGVSTDPYVFMPDAKLTRAQVIQTLYQLEGKPETDYVTDYSDVAANQWFAKAIAWGTENGIVEGRDTGEFDPDGNITREELVTILYRYVTEYKKVPVGTAPAIPETYTDADRIGFFGVDAFAWAIDSGMVNGMTETTLEPQGLATRAQLAKMITIFLQ